MFLTPLRTANLKTSNITETIKVAFSISIRAKAAALGQEANESTAAWLGCSQLRGVNWALFVYCSQTFWVRRHVSGQFAWSSPDPWKSSEKLRKSKIEGTLSFAQHFQNMLEPSERTTEMQNGGYPQFCINLPKMRAGSLEKLPTPKTDGTWGFA